MELLGSKNLTVSELLAIIIKNGTKELSCVEIAQNILKRENVSNISDLEYLDMMSVEELKSFKGIGKVKAIEIKACLELAKRYNKELLLEKYKITTPKEAFELVRSSFYSLKYEIMKVIILNKQNKVVSVIDVASGQVDKIDIDIRQIFSEPLKQMASSIILCHNHPGGSLNPSKQDIIFTKKIFEYSKIFNINLIDHIIITNDDYLSMMSKGYV